MKPMIMLSIPVNKKNNTYIGIWLVSSDVSSKSINLPEMYGNASEKAADIRLSRIKIISFGS